MPLAQAQAELPLAGPALTARPRTTATERNTTMRGAVLHAPGDVRVEQREDLAGAWFWIGNHLQPQMFRRAELPADDAAHPGSPRITLSGHGRPGIAGT